MSTVALIACSSRKHPASRHRALPARKVYTGQLFRAAWAYATAVLGLPEQSIFILSARHGLLPSNHLIRHYDEALAGLPKAHREAWAARVLAELRALVGLDELTVYVLAGKVYREFLAPALEAQGVDVRLPVPAGLGYARQVAWLKGQVAAAGH
jgi:cytoplasmic iron level regulating protein YaaA (DUF328/UPF0246 family)